MKKIIIALLLFIICNTTFSSPRRVLLELGTSVDCSICPNAHRIISDSILPSYPQTVVLSIHANEVTPYSHDPYANFHGDEIRDLLNINFPTPGLWVDRTTEYSVAWFAVYDTLKNRYMMFGTSPLSIDVTTKNYNPATRQFTATVNITPEQNINGIYYINFVITEDNLIYKQSGAGDNYVHHWVVRDMVNEARGDLLINGSWLQNQQIQKNFSATLDTGWVPGNCKYAFFVYKANYPDSSLGRAEVIQATNGSITGSIGIKKYESLINGYSLSQNYPNPFNPYTNIKFSVPKSEYVSLKVYDALGKEIEVLFNGNLSAGTYNAEFNATNLSSGIYFYVLKTNSYNEKKKMVLIK